jgi:hypothetical protein
MPTFTLKKTIYIFIIWVYNSVSQVVLMHFYSTQSRIRKAALKNKNLVRILFVLKKVLSLQRDLETNPHIHLSLEC